MKPKDIRIKVQIDTAPAWEALQKLIAAVHDFQATVDDLAVRFEPDDDPPDSVSS
jgi:hypothetical protein